jgi:hypothetical protein
VKGEVAKWLLLFSVVLLVPLGCSKPTPTPELTPTPWFTATLSPTGTPAPTPTSPVTYSVPELKYLVIDKYGEPFYVDFDFYPVAREGQEEANAQAQFTTIRADGTEFAAILKHLGLTDKADYSLEEKVHIYREHKKLSLGVQLTASGSLYTYTLRIGEGQGWRIEGTIAPSGQMTETEREPSFNTYPICLSKGTLIDTPGGPLPVEQLRPGMAVWTLDSTGQRAAAVVLQSAVTPVPWSFRMLRISLSDGRSLTASPGHSAADGRALASFRPGDILDGAIVLAAEYAQYDGAETYDLLPSGDTALYWANGILLRSTLADS